MAASQSRHRRVPNLHQRKHAIAAHAALGHACNGIERAARSGGLLCEFSGNSEQPHGQLLCAVCHIVAKKTFSWIDSQVWSTLWRWAKRRHPNKSARWVKAKYFKSRGYRDWMFTAIDESNKHKKLSLVLEADIPIKRHVQIKGMANPHDPAWKQYFEARRNKQRTKSTLRCCRVPQGAFAEA